MVIGFLIIFRSCIDRAGVQRIHWEGGAFDHALSDSIRVSAASVRQIWYELLLMLQEYDAREVQTSREAIQLPVFMRDC